MPFVKEITPYTIESFEGIGGALCISVLDIDGKNDYSRIFNTPFRSIKMMRYWTGLKISKVVPYKYDPVIRKISTRLEL